MSPNKNNTTEETSQTQKTFDKSCQSEITPQQASLIKKQNDPYFKPIDELLLTRNVI